MVAPDITFSYLPLVKNFEIQSVLGSGNFGTVYKAIWKKENLTSKGSGDKEEFEDVEVALKELKLNSTNESSSLYRDFQQEIFIMSQLKHQNVVQLFGKLSTFFF